jgi:hypothetical protein
MISYDFYCKFETTTTFLKSPFNLSSANSQFFSSRKREMKKRKRVQYIALGSILTPEMDSAGENS